MPYIKQITLRLLKVNSLSLLPPILNLDLKVKNVVGLSVSIKNGANERVRTALNLKRVTGPRWKWACLYHEERKFVIVLRWHYLRARRLMFLALLPVTRIQQ
jgi:hypothetical protein